MKWLMRCTALVTLAAFLGLSALEAFHTHGTLQTEASCSVCQIAHRTPSLVGVASPQTPQFNSVEALTPVVLASYVQFLSTSHGLSPPLA